MARGGQEEQEYMSTFYDQLRRSVLTQHGEFVCSLLSHFIVYIFYIVVFLLRLTRSLQPGPPLSSSPPLSLSLSLIVAFESGLCTTPHQKSSFTCVLLLLHLHVCGVGCARLLPPAYTRFTTY